MELPGAAVFRRQARGNINLYLYHTYTINLYHTYSYTINLYPNTTAIIFVILQCRLCGHFVVLILPRIQPMLAMPCMEGAPLALPLAEVLDIQMHRGWCV